MSVRSRPRRFRPSRAALFLAVLAPIILAAIIEGLWMAVVAFSGEAPPPSPTATPLPSATPTPTPTPPARRLDAPHARRIWGKVSERTPTEGVAADPEDSAPVPGATVRIPQLGLEAVTDEDGYYFVPGPPVAGPRLLTFEFSAPGFGPLVVKNELCQPDWSRGCGYSPMLERGDTAVVIDYCAFQSPPFSAASGFHAGLCVEAGVAPRYLMLRCPLPQRHQQSILLASIVGSAVDVVTGQPIEGATVAIEDYQESRVTGENGCFLLDPLSLPSAEGRLITVEVTAAGYRPLILEHFWLSSARTLDVRLEAGLQAETVDYCVFSSLPQRGIGLGQAQACRRAGILVVTGQ